MSPGVIDLRDSWPKAAMTIASGGSNADAGKAAKVSARTIQRWRNDEVQFADAVNEFRSEFLQETAGLLAAATTAASRKLAEIVDTGEERHQLTAARVVLDMASRYRVDQALELRISDLETAAGLRG